MASPQRENGHLDIANELVEILIKTNLNGGEFRMILLVLRKTWAWGKYDDWISLSQMCEMTGFTRKYISTLKKGLIEKNILLQDGSKVKFNKNYDEWVVYNSTLVNSSTLVYNSSQGSVQQFPSASVQGVRTQKKLLQKKLTKENCNMKTHKEFVNEYRERAGKEKIGSTLTEKQLDFITRSKLVPIFKQAVNEIHSKSYFTDPDDIADLKKENSRINAQIKIFWIRCKKDLKKATEVIKWFSGDYGKWKNWSPGYCFRKDTVIDFENRDMEGKKVGSKSVAVITGKGVFET